MACPVTPIPTLLSTGYYFSQMTRIYARFNIRITHTKFSFYFMESLYSCLRHSTEIPTEINDDRFEIMFSYLATLFFIELAEFQKLKTVCPVE